MPALDRGRCGDAARTVWASARSPISARRSGPRCFRLFTRYSARAKSMHGCSPLRRHRHRQRHCRRARARRGRLPGHAGMDKGGMALIDETRPRPSTRRWARRAKAPAAPRRTPSSASPFSAAAPAFIGTVKDDTLGAYLHPRHSRRQCLSPRRRENGPATARCYILVTPDGERTMNTYLGAAQNLKPGDIDELAGRSRGRRLYPRRLFVGPAAGEGEPSSRRRQSRKPAGSVALTLSGCISASTASRVSRFSSEAGPSILCSRTKARIAQPSRNRRFR